MVLFFVLSLFLGWSIFECFLSHGEQQLLAQQLSKKIDTREDAIALYRLCNKDHSRVAVDGTGKLPILSDYHLV